MPKKRSWFIPYIADPSLLFFSNFFSGYSNGDIYLLSMKIVMNRCLKTDELIDPPCQHQLDVDIRVPNPKTAYIPEQTLTFRTPLTPGESFTIKKLIGQAQILIKCLEDYQPTNPIYINQIELLQQMPDGGFNKALFQKNEKIKKPKVRKQLGRALLERNIMTVDLEQINTNVKTKVYRRGGGKPYTKGNKIGKGHLYTSPAVTRRHLPSFQNSGLLGLRECYGTLKQAMEVSIDQCKLHRF